MADQIEDHLDRWGYQTTRQTIEEESLQGANIIGEIPGETDRLVLITAHYDTVPNSPGADDNGSGVAGLLECARLLARGQYHSTLQIVAFDFEELQESQGLVGSSEYARHLKGENRTLGGVLNFEMIGFTNSKEGSQTLPQGFELLYPKVAQRLTQRNFRGDFLAAIGSRDSGELLAIFEEVATLTGLPLLTLMAPPSAGDLPDLLRSDHAPFWALGYPALMLTDTSEYRNPHYHSPRDKIETLDFEFLTQVVETTVKAAQSLLS